MRILLLKPEYLEYYKKKQPISLIKHFNKIKEMPFDNEIFGYSVSASSVFSSLIEGNRIDLDTYLKYSNSGMNTQNKSFIEIEDLINAYLYAKKAVLNFNNFLKAHSIMSKTLISDTKYRGKIRDKEVYIFGNGVKIYTGASSIIVKEETKRLFYEIEAMIKKKMNISEIFYYASMIHLVFAQIHPFADGNGRSVRLLEKWFLSGKLGNNAWLIPSEKLYHTRIKSYYKNINIGDNYLTLNYDLSIPFLFMLPMALTIKKK